MSGQGSGDHEDGYGSLLAPTRDARVRQRMNNVRNAFRLCRLARDQRRLHALYDEHNLFAEADDARHEMLRLLRTARASWRIALGFMN